MKTDGIIFPIVVMKGFSQQTLFGLPNAGIFTNTLGVQRTVVRPVSSKLTILSAVKLKLFSSFSRFF